MPDSKFYALRDALIEDVDIAQKYLDANPDALESRDGMGETALHWFAVEDDLEIVAWLRSKGATVNNRTEFDETPLSEAASLGHEEMCRYLLSVGGDPTIGSTHGYTALGAAAINDNVSIVRLILEHLPDDENVNAHLSKVAKSIFLDPKSESAALLIQRGLTI